MLLAQLHSVQKLLIVIKNKVCQSSAAQQVPPKTCRWGIQMTDLYPGQLYCADVEYYLQQQTQPRLFDLISHLTRPVFLGATSDTCLYLRKQSVKGAAIGFSRCLIRSRSKRWQESWSQVSFLCFCNCKNIKSYLNLTLHWDLEDTEHVYQKQHLLKKGAIKIPLSLK